MLALLYLILAFFVGWVIKQLFRVDTLSLFARISGRTNKLPPTWTFDFPFSIIVGGTVLTTVHYYFSFLFSLVLPDDINPMLATNLFFIPLLILFFFLSYHYVLKKSHLPAWNDYFSKADAFYWKTLWFFGLFSIFIICYSFFVYRGILNSGATVFGDFAPHTAIINSFAKGNNFPTQYPHFANDGIQYHFFFFYLCANLVFLGFRIDFAMNIPSILGILSFTLLLGCLGFLLTKRKLVFFLAPFMLFFRSSYAIFSYLGELIGKEGSTPLSVIVGIFRTDKFIGTSLHDDWGLWNLNVYANQRHLLWGFSIMLIILFIFLPSIKTSIFKSKKDQVSVNPPIEYENENIHAIVEENEKSVSRVQKVVLYFTDSSLWKIQKPSELILCVILIACLPYWHGSILISMLCILFVMAFFARSRLSYIIVAGAGVMSALLQARFFSGGASNVANPTFLWGFISDDKSVLGVAGYLFQVLGIAFVFMLVLPFFQEKFQNRVFVFACLSPIVFALTISLTPDVTVNHKYIIIAIALLNIFIADLFCNILQVVKNSYKDLKKQIKTNFIRKPNHSLPQPDHSGNQVLNEEQKESQNLSNEKSDEEFDDKPDSFTSSKPALSSEFKNMPILNPLSKKIFIFILSSLISILIAFSLFATGIPEFIGYINKNISTVKVDLNSPLTKWIETNTDPKDVFLTAPYHMNEFFFSGRKVFYGWAYFTWSAGHDTASREVIVKNLFNGCGGDLDEFLAIVKQYGIRYAIIDNELISQKTYVVNLDFFKTNFKVAAFFPSIRNSTIYKLY